MNSLLANEYLVTLAADADTNRLIQFLKDIAQWLKDMEVDQWQYLLGGGEDGEIAAAVSAQYTYIVLKDKEIIATFTLAPTPSDWDHHIFGKETDNDSLYLHRLAVSPSYMGKGLGKNILQWIPENIETEKGYIKLDCVAHNVKLNRFYQNNGFDYIGETDSHSKYQRNIR
ncbi:GNAT family N-acetyltransferase [Bacillus sp. FJAT-49736]|uniref:GNAT family N-acetyltransferase n=1 Tax=Bacillus sp. FJAT-49736 TaxID=2833582 RepID=UPI001BC95CCE|nr:GNAT family N-acetyltransferase [Bacillus sp. FJAT-49736]MBS4172913.1 GNAT family N-acetyltransferase [Bacillus sp. FJAT-49736]